MNTPKNRQCTWATALVWSALALLAPTTSYAGLGGSLGLQVALECDGQFGRSDWECPLRTVTLVNAAGTEAVTGNTSGFAPQRNTNNASALGYAKYGRVGTSTSTSASSESPLGSFQPHTYAFNYARAEAQNRDLLTMTSPSFSSGAGSMQFVVRLSGSLTAMSTGIALGNKSLDGFGSDVYFSIKSYTQTGFSTAFAVAKGDLYVDTGAPIYRFDRFPKDVVITVPFVWGQPFQLAMDLTTHARAEVDAPLIPPDDPFYRFPRTGSAAASFEHTAALGGIRNVMSGGQAVTMWSVVSQSGTDYTRNFATPVPEPQALSLLLAGLGVVAYAVRRQSLS